MNKAPSKISVFLVAFMMLLTLILPEVHIYAASVAATPRKIKVDGVDMDYEGTNGKVSYNGTEINNTKCRSVVLNNAAYLWARRVFEKGLGCDYTYISSTGEIVIRKNEITVRMFLNSHEAYINDLFVYCEDAPKMLYSYDTGYEYVMVPGRFVCENLGYYYEWDSTKGVSMISDTEKTGIDQGYSSYLLDILEPQEGCGTGISDPADRKYRTARYFSWESVPEGSDNLSEALFSVSAYADENGEYIRFTGTTALEPYITKKNNYFMISFKDVKNFIGTNYAETKKKNLLKSFNLYDEDNEITLAVETDEYTDMGYSISYENSLHTEVIIRFVQRESADSRQWINIPVPEDINPSDVTILDRYDECLITLRIAGNYSEFYTSCSIPYEARSILQIRTYYNQELNRTTVNMYSDRVCAFKVREDYPNNCISFLIDRPENMYDRILILDAGHGGNDPGTTHEGYNEKDVNFNIVYKYAKQLFDASGIYVYYSRFDDTLVPLAKRASYAESIGADLFVSVHQNSNYKTSISGTSVYYSAKNTSVGPCGLTSKTLASRFLAGLTDTLNTIDRGTIAENFVVVRDSKCPAVLLECGFMSNHDELMRIKTATFQKKVAKVIFRTVKDIFRDYRTDRFEITQ